MSSYDAGPSGFEPDFGYGRANAAGAVAIDGALEARILGPEAYAHLVAATPVLGLVRGTGLARYELALGAGEAPSALTCSRRRTPIVRQAATIA